MREKPLKTKGLLIYHFLVSLTYQCTEAMLCRRIIISGSLFVIFCCSMKLYVTFEYGTKIIFIPGNLADVRTFITLSKGVILRVFLVEPLTAEVQLFIRYTNTESGESINYTTPFSYVQSKEIVIFDENVPYQKFTVDVALKSGSLKGPLYQDHRVYGKCFIVADL